VALASSLHINKLHRKKIHHKSRGACELPPPFIVSGECSAQADCTPEGAGITNNEQCAEGEVCCPQPPVEESPATPPTPPPAPVDDPLTHDDPAAHTAIWFHGKDNCRGLKAMAKYPGRSDVITPISPTDDGGATGDPTVAGAPCHNWQFAEDPWPRAMPQTAQLTVSGYSMGRHGMYNFIRLHGDSVQRAVLFDPSYDDGQYPTGEPGKTERGMEIVRRWLRGDHTRVFVFAYGGATLSLGINPWKVNFLDVDTEDIRQQVFVVHDTNIIHGLIPQTYRDCLFDNTCGGRANHDYSLSNYRT